MIGRRLTELINLSSNTRHAGFTDDAILVMWCVIGCLHQWFLLVNGYGFYMKKEIDSIRTDFAWKFQRYVIFLTALRYLRYLRCVRVEIRRKPSLLMRVMYQFDRLQASDEMNCLVHLPHVAGEACTNIRTASAGIYWCMRPTCRIAMHVDSCRKITWLTPFVDKT